VTRDRRGGSRSADDSEWYAAASRADTDRSQRGRADRRRPRNSDFREQLLGGRARERTRKPRRTGAGLKTIQGQPRSSAPREGTSR